LSDANEKATQTMKQSCELTVQLYMIIIIKLTCFEGNTKQLVKQRRNMNYVPPLVLTWVMGRSMDQCRSPHEPIGVTLWPMWLLVNVLHTTTYTHCIQHTHTWTNTLSWQQY